MKKKIYNWLFKLAKKVIAISIVKHGTQLTPRYLIDLGWVEENGYYTEPCNTRQLSIAAYMLLSVDYEEGIDSESYPFGWDADICNKMINKSYEERLIIAGALLAAEIDRIQK